MPDTINRNLRWRNIFRCRVSNIDLSFYLQCSVIKIDVSIFLYPRNVRKDKCGNFSANEEKAFFFTGRRCNVRDAIEIFKSNALRGSINARVYGRGAHARGVICSRCLARTLEHYVYYGLNNIVYDNGFAKPCIWNIAISLSNTRISHGPWKSSRSPWQLGKSAKSH